MTIRMNTGKNICLLVCKIKSVNGLPIILLIDWSPHCDNHYVIPADEPQLEVGIETDDPRINNKVLKDDRMKSNQPEYLQQYLQQQQQHQSR